MLNFLKSLSKKAPTIKDDLYQWKYIDVSALDQFPDAITDIYEEKYVGIIIRNVFSAEEVALMKKGVEEMDTSRMISTGVGYSFPRIFAQLVRPHDGSEVKREDIKHYFKECESLPEVLYQILGVDLKDRVEAIFRKINGSRRVEVAKGYDKEGSYAFGSVRINLGGKGFIPVHCGNYFQQEFPSFYEHLKTEVQIKNQLSYFVTVNPAEKGGELSLFDLKWEEGQKKEDTADDRGVSLPNKEFIDLGPESPIKKQKVKPGAGDLLIFSGGPVWHKVELVEGNNSRITIGGFLALNKEKDTLKYWT